MLQIVFDTRLQLCLSVNFPCGETASPMIKSFVHVGNICLIERHLFLSKVRQTPMEVKLALRILYNIRKPSRLQELRKNVTHDVVGFEIEHEKLGAVYELRVSVIEVFCHHISKHTGLLIALK